LLRLLAGAYRAATHDHPGQCAVPTLRFGAGDGRQRRHRVALLAALFAQSQPD
jgi:hypothetical protein